MADGELMRQHYAAASAEEQGKLWTLSSTMSGGGATTVVTPRMLLIPMNCLQFLMEKPRTPFEFYEFVCNLATNDSTVDEVEWDLGSRSGKFVQLKPSLITPTQ